MVKINVKPSTMLKVTLMFEIDMFWVNVLLKLINVNLAPKIFSFFLLG